MRAPLLAWLTVLALVTAPLAGRLRAAEPAPVEPVPVGIAERITTAESAFRVQNYPRVVGLLEPLVGHPKLEGRPEHVKVLEWLGASHWFVGATDLARLVFGQLLREAPFHELDEFVYPGELIAFVEARRKELVEANIIPARPDLPDGGPRRVLLRTVTQHDTPWPVYLAPFALGQFANDEPGKGTALAVLQGIGAVTMAATWIGIESLKIDGGDQIGSGDAGEARLLNALWFAGMGLFVASWAFSIADGFANRRTAPTIDERIEYLAPEDMPAARPDEVRIELGPGPGDLGLGLGLRF